MQKPSFKNRKKEEVELYELCRTNIECCKQMKRKRLTTKKPASLVQFILPDRCCYGNAQKHCRFVFRLGSDLTMNDGLMY